MCFEWERNIAFLKFCDFAKAYPENVLLYGIWRKDKNNNNKNTKHVMTWKKMIASWVPSGSAIRDQGWASKEYVAARGYGTTACVIHSGHETFKATLHIYNMGHMSLKVCHIYSNLFGGEQAQPSYLHATMEVEHCYVCVDGSNKSNLHMFYWRDWTSVYQHYNNNINDMTTT